MQTANVSDTLTYTVKLTNGKSASSAWKEVVLTDDLPDGLAFVDSSVYVDGKSAEHSFKEGVLSIPVDDIAAGQTDPSQYPLRWRISPRALTPGRRKSMAVCMYSGAKRLLWIRQIMLCSRRSAERSRSDDGELSRRTCNTARS